MDELPILLYTTPEGAVKVKAVLKDETMWLTQGAWRTFSMLRRRTCRTNEIRFSEA